MRRVFMSGKVGERELMLRTKVFVLTMLCVVIVACQPKSSSPRPGEREYVAPYVMHTVQYSGETLSIIAAWYTGSNRNWEALLKANPGLNPNRIRLGDVIQIPRALITRDDPMPRSAVGGGQSRKPGTEVPRQAETPRAPGSNGEPSGSDSGSVDPAIVTETPSGEPAVITEEPLIVEEAPVVEDTPEIVADAPPSDSGEVVAPDDTQSSAPAEENKEMRIKTRDELLKELLEE